MDCDHVTCQLVWFHLMSLSNFCLSLYNHYHMNPSLSSAVSSRCKLIPLYYNLISPSSESLWKPLLRMLLVNIRKILYCWHFLHLSELGSWKTELPQRVGPCRFQTILQLSWCCSGSFYVILEVSINYCCSISIGLNTILSWNLLCDINQFITLNLTWDSQNACTMEVVVLVKISHHTNYPCPRSQ